MRKSIFHEDWWLDTVAPGQWAQVETERGYLRYAYRSKMMFRECPMPPLTRTLGPVVSVEGKKIESRQRAFFSAVTELLEKLPDFDHVTIRLDPSFTDVLPFQALGYQASVQHTFLADCAQPEQAIWSEMRDKTRNIVRRAQDSLTIAENEDADSFARYYAANLDEKSYVDMRLVPAIYAAARAHGQARILTATDAKGEIHAQSMFVWDDHSYYYYLSSRNERIAHAGAVSALVWSGMQHAHQLGLTFDFDGVTSQSRYQFMVGFGGKPATRFVVQKGALLFDAQRTARQFTDRLRGRPVYTFS